MHTGARTLLTVCLAFSGATCVAVATFVLHHDPYWVATGEDSGRVRPALDTRTRFSKAVQLVARAPRRVLVGSSTVYRGLDPAMIDDDVPTYNLGISSLRILEARHYVRHALRFAPVEEVVLGLDFFMFDAKQRTEPGFDPGLGGLDARIDMAFASVWSWHALLDAWRTGNRGTPTDGVWQHDGHKRSFPRTAESNAALLESAKREYAAMDPTRGPGLADLEALIALCAERAVRLRIFLTPVHASYRAAIAAAGREEDFSRWKAGVLALATGKGVTILDMNLANPTIDSPLTASTRYYIDPSHYSPLVGAAILESLGLRVRPDVMDALAREGLLGIGKPTPGPRRIPLRPMDPQRQQSLPK